jgi:hypothetical protein
MSRYHGPQQSGAARKARTDRRCQAEQRQAASRQRGARQRVRDAAPTPLLTDDERAVLVDALDAHLRAARNWAALTDTTTGD